MASQRGDRKRRAKPERGSAPGRRASAARRAPTRGSAPSGNVVDDTRPAESWSAWPSGCVIAAVFVGSKTVARFRPAERLRRRRQTGSGDRGARRGLDHGDRRDAAQARRGPDRQSVSRSRARQSGDFGDPARLLPAAYRASGGGGGEAARRSGQPGGQAGDSRRSATRRHLRRQDQRHHARHLHDDRQGQLRRSGRQQALRVGRRSARGGRKDRLAFASGAALGGAVGDGDGSRPPSDRGPDRAGNVERQPVSVAGGDPVDADQRQLGAVPEVGPAGHRHRDEHVAVRRSGGGVAGSA